MMDNNDYCGHAHDMHPGPWTRWNTLDTRHAPWTHWKVAATRYLRLVPARHITHPQSYQSIYRRDLFECWTIYCDNVKVHTVMWMSPSHSCATHLLRTCSMRRFWKGSSLAMFNTTSPRNDSSSSSAASPRSHKVISSCASPDTRVYIACQMFVYLLLRGISSAHTVFLATHIASRIETLTGIRYRQRELLLPERLGALLVHRRLLKGYFFICIVSLHVSSCRWSQKKYTPNKQISWEYL